MTQGERERAEKLSERLERYDRSTSPSPEGYFAILLDETTAIRTEATAAAFNEAAEMVAEWNHLGGGDYKVIELFELERKLREKGKS